MASCTVEIRVRGQRAYILQPTSPPVEEHLFEILLLADACRRAGADHLTAIMPYFGYARQDRRAVGRDPIAARVASDVLAVCYIDDCRLQTRRYRGYRDTRAIRAPGRRDTSQSADCAHGHD